MANVRPQVSLLYPADNVTDTLTPTIEWGYTDAGGNEQKAYRIYIEEIIVGLDSTGELIVDSDGNVVYSVDATNFFNWDSQLIQSNQTYHLLDQALTSGGYYKITLQVVNAVGIDSLAVQKIFSVYTDVNIPSLKIKPDTLTTESLQPKIEWEFVDPENLPHTGYEILYKEGDTIVYDSKRVGSVDKYHVLPSGIITDAMIASTGEQVLTLLLTVYSSGNRQATERMLLTITRTPPVISKFYTNEQGVSDTAIEIFDSNVVFRTEVANVVDMTVVEASTADEITDYSVLGWYDYRNSLEHTVQNTTLNTEFYFWVLFRSAAGKVVSQMQKFIYRDSTTIEPRITERSPQSGDTSFPTTSAIRVRFNKLMDHTSLSNSFNLSNVSTGAKIDGNINFVVDNDNSVLVFIPLSVLNFDTEYSISLGPYSEVNNDTVVIKYPVDRYGNILGVAKDIDGNIINNEDGTPIVNAVVWTFTAEESVDKTPPGDASIVINSGASFTNSRVVTLGLYASGDPVLMRLFGNIVAGKSGDTGWIPYKSNYNVNLTSLSGTKTVQVMYKDNSGNECMPVSDAILYKDITPPGVPTLVSFDDSVIYYPYVDVSGILNDPGVTVLLYKDKYTNSHIGMAEVSGNNDFVITDVPLSVGENIFTAKSMDENGNVSAASSSITISYQVPDKVRPRVYKVIVADNTNILLFYDKQMMDGEIGSLINYSIDDLVVQGVQVVGFASALGNPISLDGDGNKVVILEQGRKIDKGEDTYYVVNLKTSSQADKVYTAQVNNVHDVYDNLIDPSGDYTTFLGSPLVDTYRPMVKSATATSNTTVLIEFSEDVVDTGPKSIKGTNGLVDVEGYGALLLKNYSMPPLQILSIVKTDNSRVYKLFTSPQSDVLYDVYVSNVADANNNKIDVTYNNARFNGIPSFGAGSFIPIRAYSLLDNKVRVEFSDNIDRGSASNIDNYSIMGLDIVSVSVVDNNTVELVTSRQVKVMYGLTISNVKSASSS